MKICSKFYGLLRITKLDLKKDYLFKHCFFFGCAHKTRNIDAFVTLSFIFFKIHKSITNPFFKNLKKYKCFENPIYLFLERKLELKQPTMFAAAFLNGENLKNKLKEVNKCLWKCMSEWKTLEIKSFIIIRRFPDAVFVLNKKHPQCL